MVLIVALVVAAVVVPVSTVVARLVQRRRRPPSPHPDPRLAEEARRAAHRQQADSRIDMERSRGRVWPH